MKYKIVVDKQPSTNPTEEKRIYEIDIEELRYKGNIYDSLVITKDSDYVIRRLSLSEYHVLSVLDKPIKEPLEDINIELFEGNNYIYLSNMTGNYIYVEYLVKNDFTDIYVTRNEMNSTFNQAAEQIELSVNQKLTNYATTEEMNSAMDMKAGEINQEVEKKVDKEVITGAYLILKINGDTSEEKLNADKIELTANDILNLIAGNTINLSGKNIIIASDSLNIDKNGKITIIDKTGNHHNYFVVKDASGNIKIEICSTGIYLKDVAISDNAIAMGNTEAEFVDFNKYHFTIGDRNNITNIMPNLIETPKLTQTSLESIKKNISKLDKNALDIISQANIYEYNLKSEQDKDKKHIGFIIGEGYNTPQEVISKEGNSIELYSAIGILWKAMQEQQEKNKELTKRIEELEAR